MSNITYKSFYYLFILHPQKFSHLKRHLFIFVELFRFVGEQIGFKVFDIEPDRCTFLSILVV